jgi:Fe-S-cluster containining protein
MSQSTGPCDNCGLCCENLLVEATAVDVLREPRIDKARPIRKRGAELPVLEAYWILAGPGDPCPFLTPKKRCDIYPTRPNGCVAFAPASPKCQKLRIEHGLKPVELSRATRGILTEIMQAVIAEETNEPDWE